MLRPYIPLGSIALGLPIPRRRRHLHLRHHPVSKPGTRSKLRKLDQLEHNLTLALGFSAAQGALGEMHGPGGGEKALRPELDFVSSEMHGDVSHWVSYGPVLGLVSVPAIFQITPQFITGSVDIGFDGAQGQIQRVRDLLVRVPLDVT